MIVTADTNVFLYSIDDRDPEKFQAAFLIVEALRNREWPVGLQVAGEFYRVATRKMKMTDWEASAAARRFITAYPTFAATRTSTERALTAAAAGRFSFWDANLLAAAEAAGCTHIISEDMADGARLGRIEVVAAFGPDGGVSDRARALLQIDET